MKKMDLLKRQIMQIMIPVILLVLVLIATVILFSGILNNLAVTFETESFTSIALVLNADRDFYQALDGYNNMLIHSMGSQEYEDGMDSYLSNIGDVENRMGQIGQIASENLDIAVLTMTDAEGSVANKIDIFFAEFEKWKNASASVVEKIENGATEEELIDDISLTADLFNNAREELNTIGEALEQYPSVLANQSLDFAKQMKLIMYIIAGAVVLVTNAISFVLTKRLVGQISRIAVQESGLAENLMGASYQLSETSQQLSEGSNEQAASIEETSATMEETSSMVRQNAENTRQANALSKETSQAALEGSSKMQEMTQSMEELKKSSSEISKIIKVIDEIAFQTNMLALNAAVEAARAGEAGQGFAVVAEEVRNLAQKSAKAAKDTAEIIDKNIELSERGASISGEVNISLNEIMEKAKNVNQLMGEITAASEEQARGTAQVTEAIGQMEKVVQSNAATAEESAASAEELQNQAQSLRDVVLELTVLVKGKSSKETPKESLVDNNLPKTKKLAEGKHNFRKQIVSPDEVIPLDDSDDF